MAFVESESHCYQVILSYLTYIRLFVFLFPPRPTILEVKKCFLYKGDLLKNAKRQLLPLDYQLVLETSRRSARHEKKCVTNIVSGFFRSADLWYAPRLDISK